MFQKIIQLENIKQWQHKGGSQVFFDKLNLIYGRNGSGKSTLGKIFEHINQDDASSIRSLSPIETTDEPVLNFLIDGSSVTLTSLDKATSSFQVFNQTFIDNNLYTSKGVESSQLVNYYEFFLGSVSVTHQKDIDKLKADNDTLTTQITPLSTKIRAKFGSKTIAKIRKIKEVSNADSQLEKLQEQLQDIKSIEHFRKRSKLSKIALERPDLDKSCFVTTIAKLSKEAQDKVEEHIKSNLTEQDNGWLEDGLKLVTETESCPFCAQPLSTSPIYHLYQEFMNEAYLTASTDFELKSAEFELDVSSIGVEIEEQKEVVKCNSEIIREWSDRIPSIEASYDFKTLNKLSTKLYLECRKLIVAKEKDLLADTNFSQFNDFFEQVFTSVNFSDYNTQIQNFNDLIDSFLQGLGTETSQSIQIQIDVINESKARYETNLVQNLSDLKNLESQKSNNTTKISELRETIAKEQEESIGNHKDSINRLLKNFNSMIRIKELEKDNKGHRGASRITYAITFIDNELSILNDNERIFEHILSLGDRSALALAFFLSKFTTKNNDNTIVVLDDPMSSLDGHRRNATIIEVGKLVNSGYQTFVLSHDPFFLSDVLKHSTLSKDTKCFEIEVDYIDINPLNADSSQYVSSKLIHRESYESYVLHSYHKEYNKLFEFVKSGKDEDKGEIARSIRPILEAHLRFLFPNQFTEGKWLGDMIPLIRDETDETSVFFDKGKRLASIEKINEFSKSYHHANGFDTQIQNLDFQTVKGYAKETLGFITGL